MSITSTKNSFIEHFTRYHGLYYMILGELTTSIMSVAAKLLEQDTDFDEPINPYEILCLRMFITYLGCLAFMKWQDPVESIWGPRELRWALLIRGIGGYFYILGLYYPLVYLSLSDVTSITFLGPTFTAIVAYFALHEQLTLFEMVGGFISFGGVILIAKPNFLFGDSLKGNLDDKVETSDPHQRFIAIVISLIGVLAGAVSFTAIRYIGGRASRTLITSYYASVTTVISFVTIMVIPSLHFQWLRTLKQWVLLMFIIIPGFMSQYFFATGLRAEKASTATTMAYTQIVFVLMWEVIIWAHIPNIWSCLGMLIILGSSISVFWYKNRSTDEPTFQRVEDEENQQNSDQFGFELGELRDK